MAKLKDLGKEREVFNQDLIEEILMKSAVKTLMCCRCVSKKWLGLIGSPNFIEMHHKHSSRTSYILVTHSPGDRYHSLSVLDYESLELVNSVELEFPPLCCVDLRICGPCNGLICLIDPRNEIMLYNPPMGELKLLPPRNVSYEECLKYTFLGYGFGYDSKTRDYKVVVLVTFNPFLNASADRDDNYIDNLVARGQLTLIDGEKDSIYNDYYDYLSATKVDIYDLSTNSWREIVYDGPDRLTDISIHEKGHGVLFNGALHWTVRKDYTNIILSFDMSTEVFQDIELPDDLLFGYGYYKTLTVLNNSLALFACSFYNLNPEEQFIDIWVMEEYGVKTSWTKQDRIGPFKEIECALMLWKNKVILLESIDGQLLSCDIETHEIREFNIHGQNGFMRAMIFQESLVSLT